MIVRARGGSAVEFRTGFALTDMAAWGYQGLRNIRPKVGETEIRGIPALYRAARLRSEAVAQLELCCWRGLGPTRERVDTVWQAKLFRNGPQPFSTNPVQTRFVFWETVEESLAWRNNAYIWVNIDPDTNRIVEWWALHPDQVTPRYAGTEVRYRVQVAAGFVDPVGRGPAVYDATPDTILHIRGHGQGGQLQAPTPVEVFREKLAGPVGRQRHESRMWRRGTALQVAIEFPAGVNKEQADQWREVWRSNYEGTEGETTAVIGGGGQIKPIGMTLTDAQFVEMAHLTIEDAALIMALPADLLGVQLQRTPQDGEQIRRQWLQDGLGPELARIEDALFAFPPLFGGSQTYPAFDTSNFVRGDLATESSIIQTDVQAGIITPNEARHLKGYAPDPDPNSDKLQVTPVGGAPNPNSAPAPADPPAAPEKKTRGREQDEMRIENHIHLPAQAAQPPAQVTVEHHSADPGLVDALAQRDERLIRAIEARDRPIVNVQERDIVVPAPEVTVHVAAPNVQIDAPVDVHVPEQPAPDVNVTVQVPDEPDGPRKVTVARNPQGFITGMTIEEE